MKKVVRLLRKIQRNYVITYIDKVANNFCVICKHHYAAVLNKELGKANQYETCNTAKDELSKQLEKEIIDRSQGSVCR